MRSRFLVSLIAALAILALVATSCDGGGDEGRETDQTPTGQAPTGILAVAADIVSGPGNIPEAERGTKVCVLTSRFPKNSEVVWRVRVTDPLTGEEMDDTALESVQVTLADGQTFDFRYGGHPPDDSTDFFWATSWGVPRNYPSGSVDFEIVALATDGRTATYKPFNVAPSLLTITDEVLKTIPEEE